MSWFTASAAKPGRGGNTDALAELDESPASCHLNRRRLFLIGDRLPSYLVSSKVSDLHHTLSRNSAQCRDPGKKMRSRLKCQKTQNPPERRVDAFPVWLLPIGSRIRFRAPPCPGRQVGMGVDPTLDAYTNNIPIRRENQAQCAFTSEALSSDVFS